MIKNPIYVPKGKAREYGELAINIYKGCTNACTYCYGSKMMRMTHEDFIEESKPRDDIVLSVKANLERGYVNSKEADGTKRIELNGKLIHLCFTCDPYPANINTTPTREIIKLIKDSGNNVQILSKSGFAAVRDFDLLDENDWYGITFTGYNTADYEPYAAHPSERIKSLALAKEKGIKTWVSCEPVISQKDVEDFIINYKNIIDKIKIGKPNYVTNDIIDINEEIRPWGEWGKYIENVCLSVGVKYYIKEGLKEAMKIV